MQIQKSPVSLADLSAAGIRLRPAEAVTLVRALVRQTMAGEVAGVPSGHVIRLWADGRITVEGPVAAGGPSVVRAAQLLDSLLRTDEGGGSARMPGGLKLVLARGLRTLDLPPFASLAELDDALTRFSAADPRALVSSLVERWAAAVAARPHALPAEPGEVEPPQGAQVERFAPVENPPVRTSAPPPVDLTISDVRRARRAAGLSLAEIADRGGIPVSLLRQLEWGYLLNWPSGAEGRHLLVRYARAAGLDDRLVVGAVAPLIDQTASLRALFSPRPASPGPAAASRLDVPIREDVRISQPPGERRARRSGAGALVAASALVVGGLLPAWWAISRVAPDRALSPAHGEASPSLLAGTELAGPELAGTELAGTELADTELADTERRPQPPDAGTDSPAATEPVLPTTAEPAAAVEREPTPRGREVASRDTSAGGWRASGRDVPSDVRSAALIGDPASLASAAAVGTAMFHAPDAADATDGDSRRRPARNAVLRVTRIVGDSANNSHVRASPDGRHIAFDSDRDGERAVYVADANGQNVRRVSPDGFAAMPSWSVEGRMLAFVRGEPGQPEVWSLWTLDRDTGAIRQVTTRTEGPPQGASWFPHEERIVYGLDDRLVVHHLESGKEQTFASPRRGRVVRHPAASPDGRHVAFQVERDGTWLLDLRTGSMWRVLDDPTAQEYAWSPDGRQLAYHSARSGGWSVWVMAPRN